MSGRPDYDAGDLVVCLCDGDRVKKGVVYRVDRLYPPYSTPDQFYGWLARLSGVFYPQGHSGHPAVFYRRIDPKPPEFWTGTVSADAGERVTA